MKILPAIDLKDGQCVRLKRGDYGTAHKVAEDAVQTAKGFLAAGAELVHMVDLDGAKDGSHANYDVVKRVIAETGAKVELGGGIRAVEDFKEILRAGADKVSVNSAAVKNPGLINAAAEKYGSQCVVVAIDARRSDKAVSGFEVYVAGGRTPTGIDAVAWAKDAYARGAGEILLTSMDKDGTKSGFDLELTQRVCEAAPIPVIASGGCGTLEHFAEAFEKTDATAALAASLFHYGELRIGEVKDYLHGRGIPVRGA